MFTGIITDVGRVRAVKPAERAGDMRLTISTTWDTAAISVGASVCCSGCCLTVTEKGHGWFTTEASRETCTCTTLGRWEEGQSVNLERALAVGEELGGHLVSGHVDGVARVAGRASEGGSHRFRFEAPPALARYIAPKGSVALDGVSLTVNEVSGATFGVNIIRHTLDSTTFGSLREGDMVNIEVDMLARYVARLMDRE